MLVINTISFDILLLIPDPFETNKESNIDLSLSVSYYSFWRKFCHKYVLDHCVSTSWQHTCTLIRSPIEDDPGGGGACGGGPSGELYLQNKMSQATVDDN